MTQCWFAARNAEQALEAFEGIARRMGLVVNREKTRITKLTEGFDFIGFHFVKRRSPTTGKNTIYLFPSKDAQRNIRRRIKYFTKRRAPVAPDEFVGAINRAVRGLGELFCPHQRQRGVSALTTIHQYPLSTVPDL